MIKCGILIIAF